MEHRLKWGEILFWLYVRLNSFSEHLTPSKLCFATPHEGNFNLAWLKYSLGFWGILDQVLNLFVGEYPSWKGISKAVEVVLWSGFKLLEILGGVTFFFLKSP